MLEQKALVPMDHLRGMSSEDVALATLRCLKRGRNEITLTFKGKLLAFVCRFFPWLADKIAKKKVRELFKDEIAARHAEPQEETRPVQV